MAELTNDLATPNSQSVSLTPVLESDEDVVGAIAFTYIMLSKAPDFQPKSIDSLFREITEQQARIARRSAQKAISEHIEREVSRRIDSAKTEIAGTTYQTVMKDNFDFLVREQKANFDGLATEVAQSGNAWRQIVISVISSFVFGLMIAAAAYIANPFSEVVHKIQDQSPEPQKQDSNASNAQGK